ncbi:MAG: sigma-70 family RNA polymerase sigma factor [Bacillota bacterium]|jgi:RNA polymerase sigma factor (sigma-70 family)|nr:sigma-70 family RNA polymerase sigma factor [Bacillota bacterium]HHU30854.1 sigma-70 family RNA polymerase sigma factor [Bacillota bacterium]
MDFAKFYNLFADTVYSYIRFKIRDAYLAEDILQETFLSVYQNFAKLPDVRSPKAWVLSIAHRRMADRVRALKNQPYPASTVENEVPAETDGIGDKLFLHELLGRLDEVSRQIIYGIYVEQLSYKDLSEILGIPEGTVKSKSYYARAKLRRWLEADKNDA